MEKEYWMKRWESRNIAFHLNDTNPLLLTYANALNLKEEDRIFIPLCGKSLDIAWFLEQGYRVVGVELSQNAVEEFFQEIKESPEISHAGDLLAYKLNSIDIFVGDFFSLSKALLGKIDAIYDRAALVALPYEMRERYTEHLVKITESAKQLLITYEYDQNLLAGPPFSISEEEINQHYKINYTIQHLANIVIEGGFKGHPANENVWLLRK